VRALFRLVLAIAVVAGYESKPRDPAFAGLLDVGDGRALYMDCQGTGSPAVFIIPGKGSYAGMWNAVVPDEDQIRSSPYDLAGQASLRPSPTATQPTVAKTTRVCAYDRPNTRSDGMDRSTPVPQPHSIQQDVNDVVKLIAAAYLPTPLVVVAHSYGGLIADLLARTHPELNRAARAQMPDAGGEGFLAVDAYARIKVAPPLPKVPAVVLSSDKFPPPAALGPDDYTKFQTHQANSLLAETLATENVIVPGSGHDIMLYAPQVVAAKIVAIVDKVR
jgi:pimeloyl-ACP methyl ester carboxylesterase